MRGDYYDFLCPGGCTDAELHPQWKGGRRVVCKDCGRYVGVTKGGRVRLHYKETRKGPPPARP